MEIQKLIYAKGSKGRPSFNKNGGKVNIIHRLRVTDLPKPAVFEVENSL